MEPVPKKELSSRQALFSSSQKPGGRDYLSNVLVSWHGHRGPYRHRRSVRRSLGRSEPPPAWPSSRLAHSGTLSFHLRAFGLTETRGGAQGYWKWGPGRSHEAATQRAAPSVPGPGM